MTIFLAQVIHHIINKLWNYLFLAFATPSFLNWSNTVDLTWILDVEVLHEDFLKLSPVDPSYSKVTLSWFTVVVFLFLYETWQSHLCCLIAVAYMGLYIFELYKLDNVS